MRAIFCCSRSITVYFGLPISYRSICLVISVVSAYTSFPSGSGAPPLNRYRLAPLSSTKWFSTLRVATSITSTPA